MTKHKKRLLILIGILISAGFLWFSLAGTDFASIGKSLANANWWWCLPMLVAYVIYYWIKAIRWRLLLAPMTETTARAIFAPMMIGFTFNNILPAHLGEFVRMYLGARQLKLGSSQVLATIVLERVFDMMSVILFFGLALVVAKDVDPTLVQAGWIIAVAGGVFIVMAGLYIVWTNRFIGVLRRTTAFLERVSHVRGLGILARLRGFVLHQLEIGVEGLYALKNPRLLFWIVVTSVAQWGFMGVAAYLAIIAVGAEVQLSAAFVVLAATTFGVTLPAAPGFLGTVQAMFKIALVPYGVSVTAAFAASAFFHVPTYLIVTLPGLWLLKRTGYKMSEIREEAEAAAEEAEAVDSSGPEAPATS